MNMIRILFIFACLFFIKPVFADDAKGQVEEAVSKRAPKIISPKHLSVIEMDTEVYQFTMQWTGSATSSQFQVQISIDNKFTQLIHNQSTKKQTLKKKLNPGTYYIRVAQKDEDEELVWGKSIKIAIRKRAAWSRKATAIFSYRGTQQSLGIKTDELTGDLVIPMAVGLSFSGSYRFSDYFEAQTRATYSTGVITKEQIGITNNEQKNLTITQMSGSLLMRSYLLTKNNDRSLSLFLDAGGRYNRSYTLINKTPDLDLVRSLMKIEPLSSINAVGGFGVNSSFNRDSEGEFKFLFHKALSIQGSLKPSYLGGLICFDYNLLLKSMFFLNAGYEYEMLYARYEDTAISGTVMASEHSVKLGLGLWW